MTHFRSTSEMDAAFRFVVHAHSQASLNAPPEEPDATATAITTSLEGAHAGYEVYEIAHAGVHAAAEAGVAAGHAEVAADLAFAGASHGAASAVVGIGGMLVAPAVALAAGLVDIDHAWEEHEARGAAVDHEQMRGAMLYCLGRVPRPDRSEVVQEIGTHARDGARDAATFERLRPEAFAQLRDRVVTHHRDGERAVLLGRDRSPELERRYAEDPIFRMGVDEARAQRTADPDAFAARAAQVRAMTESVDDGRAAVGRRA